MRERMLTPTEVECLTALLGYVQPVTGEALAEHLERKLAGVTRALGGLDAEGLAIMDVDHAWALTERGRMVGLRIASKPTKGNR